MKMIVSRSIRKPSRCNQRPLIHPNGFPGMDRLGYLIMELDDSGDPRGDRFWKSYHDLWTSLDNYMGNPPLPTFKQFRKNLQFLQSVAKDDDERQVTLDLEAEIYWRKQDRIKLVS